MKKHKKIQKDLLIKIQNDSCLNNYFMLMRDSMKHMYPLPGGNNRCRNFYKALKMKMNRRDIK